MFTTNLRGCDSQHDRRRLLKVDTAFERLNNPSSDTRETPLFMVARSFIFGAATCPRLRVGVSGSSAHRLRHSIVHHLLGPTLLAP